MHSNFTIPSYEVVDQKSDDGNSKVTVLSKPPTPSTTPILQRAAHTKLVGSFDRLSGDFNRLSGNTNRFSGDLSPLSGTFNRRSGSFSRHGPSLLSPPSAIMASPDRESWRLDVRMDCIPGSPSVVKVETDDVKNETKFSFDTQTDCDRGDDNEMLSDRGIGAEAHSMNKNEGDISVSNEQLTSNEQEGNLPDVQTLDDACDDSVFENSDINQTHENKPAENENVGRTNGFEENKHHHSCNDVVCSEGCVRNSRIAEKIRKSSRERVNRENIKNWLIDHSFNVRLRSFSSSTFPSPSETDSTEDENLPRCNSHGAKTRYSVLSANLLKNRQDLSGAIPAANSTAHMSVSSISLDSHPRFSQIPKFDPPLFQRKLSLPANSTHDVPQGIARWESSQGDDTSQKHLVTKHRKLELCSLKPKVTSEQSGDLDSNNETPSNDSKLHSNNSEQLEGSSFLQQCLLNMSKPLESSGAKVDIDGVASNNTLNKSIDTSTTDSVFIRSDVIKRSGTSGESPHDDAVVRVLEEQVVNVVC